MGENRAVLFDLDGVIVDSRRTTLLALATVATAHLGRAVEPAEFETHVVDPPPDVFEAFGLTEPARAYEQDYDAAFLAAVAVTRVYDPVVAGIRELAGNGVKVGVVTRQAERRLPMLIPEELHACLDVIIAHEHARPKPAPDGILLALERVGLPAEHGLFVGDTPTDIAAARAAGVRCAAVGWGFTEMSVLRGHRPDIVLKSPGEIGLPLLRLFDS